MARLRKEFAAFFFYVGEGPLHVLDGAGIDQRAH